MLVQYLALVEDKNTLIAYTSEKTSSQVRTFYTFDIFLDFDVERVPEPRPLDDPTIIHEAGPFEFTHTENTEYADLVRKARLDVLKNRFL
jgi:hypothetical protein